MFASSFKTLVIFCCFGLYPCRNTKISKLEFSDASKLLQLQEFIADNTKRYIRIKERKKRSVVFIFYSGCMIYFMKYYRTIFEECFMHCISNFLFIIFCILIFLEYQYFCKENRPSWTLEKYISVLIFLGTIVRNILFAFTVQYWFKLDQKNWQ